MPAIQAAFRSKPMRWLLMAVILPSLVLFPAPDAISGKKGNSLSVGPSGQFATIQAAVDAAVDGDQITVEEGAYNESVVIAGKRDLVLQGGRNNTNIFGTTSHAVSVIPAGGLTTRVTGDDTQELPVGQGAPNAAGVDSGADGICDSTAAGDDVQVVPVGQGAANATGVDSGADGICDSTAAGDDVQVVPVGQGLPDTFCVRAGADGILDTAAPANDDMVDAGASLITTGADGVCDTTADPNDLQNIPVGQGAAGEACVDTGTDGLSDTTAAGDDVQAVPVGQGAPGSVCTDTGPDGVSDTAADPNDNQAIPAGQGRPSAQCVGRGPNGSFETTPAGDDDIQVFGPFGIFGEFITTGPDGICDTAGMTGDDVVGADLDQITSGPNGVCDTAAGMDETQVIPMGNGEPGSDCVTAGADATLNTAPPAGDDVSDMAGNRITSGPDGVCDTTADPNDFQALSVGQGTPGTVCITADNPLVRSRNVKIQGFGVRAPDGFNGINVERSDFIVISGVTADATLGGALPATGTFGVFVDARSVRAVIGSSTAMFQGDSGFAIQGPGARITSCTATANRNFGFLQQDTANGALYTSNVANANLNAGFGIGGSVNILQRCVAQQNVNEGFVLGGVGDILFQVTATGNQIGVRSFGAGTRIRSSAIFGNTDIGIILEPNPSDSSQTASGSEVFSNSVLSNANGGIQVDVFGVTILQNEIGPKKPTGGGRQDFGVHLTSNAQGNLLENNKLRNNIDVDGNVCAPAGSPCDLVVEGMNNAGRKNLFSPGTVPPPNFED